MKMAMDCAEKSVRNAATVCSDLFKQCIGTLGHDAFDHEFAEELWGRFNLWAAYVGAFAAPKASLDARLVGHEDIMDMVLELLIMVQKNLRHELDTKRSDNILQAEPVYETPANVPMLLGLNAVKEAVKRLHSVGLAIRRSAAKGRQHRKSFNPSEQDESRCYIDFVRHRFPHAKQSLIDQLGKSIHYRGRSMFYQQRHNKKIAEKREHNNSALPAAEEIVEQPTESIGLETLTTSSSPPKDTQHVPMSETNYSDIDRQEFFNRVSKPKPSYSHISRGSSIQDGQNEIFDYPKAPKAKRGYLDISCPICSEPFQSQGLTREIWKAHVNRDIEPYVCISEECKEPPRFFVHRRDWKEHMQREHTIDWALNIHTMTWYCEMGHSGDVVDHFDNKVDFIQHLSTTHGEALSRPQILAQARRNRTLKSRDPFTCPLCDCCPEEVAPQLAEKPYALLSAHIAQHLRALAFLSLSYVDYEEDISSSSESGIEDNLKGDGEDSNGTRLDTHGKSFDDIPSTIIEKTEVRVNGQVFVETPELEDPVTWPRELFKDYSGRDATLRRFAAALTTDTVTPMEYTVGWICAIRPEYIAAQAFLDEKHDTPEYVSPHDNNTYTCGRVGKHNIVIAVSPDQEYGIASATGVARDMLHSFPNIRICLMVGIGGGVPSRTQDIRLGDIVVSAHHNGNAGVLQFDFGKTIENQSFQRTGVLNQPPAVLQAAVSVINDKYAKDSHQLEEGINDILRKNPRLQKKYGRPDPNSDRLYRSGVVHPLNDDSSCMEVCGDEPSNLILRPERTGYDNKPAVHYGMIASANRSMKDALLRDRLATEMGILCFETEAAGLVNHFPCLVVRGICDYSDSHKYKEWQGYAAVAAAAYAKDLLSQLAPDSVGAMKKIGDILSGPHGAVEKQPQENLTKERECLQLFRLTTADSNDSYEWYKDVVEERVDGTFLWFLQHGHFQQWSKQESGPLLVTADPGCGKSVLAKYMINHQLPRSTTICYFFFKEQDQNTVRQALCALLHQLFSQKPSLITHAMSQFHIYGSDLVSSTESLWKVLQNAIKDPQAGSVVIVLDALDECTEPEFADLTWNIKSQFYGGQLGYDKLKYFLTCRPYEQLVSKFHDLQGAFPHIRIPGEEEQEAINQEAGHVLMYRINMLSKKKSLSQDVKSYLEKRLLECPHRTYLSVFLITDYLDKHDFKKTKEGVNSIIERCPMNVTEAYEQILNDPKHKDHTMARKALSIILAASRPLTLSEMNIAVNIDDTLESIHDIDLEDDEDFMMRLRSCCGLLVSIHHGKIHLFHQTVREFLLGNLSSPTAVPSGLKWQHSITTRHAHTILANVCVFYLNSFNSDVSISHAFLDYAAKTWGTHFRVAGIIDDDAIVPFALNICDPDSKSYSAWFSIYWETTGFLTPRYFTDLMVASQFGHKATVKVLVEKGASIEAKDSEYGQTPLSWATESGHESVVKLLLDNGADIEAMDRKYGRTPLLWATEKGHESVVKLLLEKGADIEAMDRMYDRTPLSWATEKGHESVVKLLLEKGADIEAKDSMYGQTPLSWATESGHESVVKLLLEKGADIEAMDRMYSRTPLSWATEKGQESVVKLLLEKGADIEAKDSMYGQTPLLWATEKGHESVVKLLLEKGADIEAKDNNSQTPLLLAVENRHESVVKLLLEKAADVEAKDNNSRTPLLLAVENRHDAVVKLLLEAGRVDVEAKDNNGRTLLSQADAEGHEAGVKLLRESS